MHPTHSADLFIFGATPAGIAAAVRAAREGASVVLAGVHSRIGGMWSNGVQVFDTLCEQHRSPLLSEILGRIQEWNRQRFGEDSPQYANSFFGDRFVSGRRPSFTPQCGLEVLGELLRGEKNVTLLAPYEIGGVLRRGRLLTGVRLHSLSGAEPVEVSARVFLDTSYEGDLFALAGAEYRVGREGRDEFGEPHAGKIFAQRGGSGRHPADAVCGRLNLRTFRLTTTEIFSGSTGEGDRAVQSYNARIALSSQPENRVPVPRPADYDRTRYLGLLADRSREPEGRYPLKSDLLFGGPEKASLGSHVGKVNGWNSANYPEANRDYPEADWPTRFTIIRRHLDHALGLLHFLQSDPEMPADLRARNAAWGLPADEYRESGHLPVEIYVREARRLVGRVILTEHDAVLEAGRERTRDRADSVAFAEWPMDSHDCSMERVAGSLNDGIILLTELTRPASIPFRSLLPTGIDNLIVPVCLSCTHLFWGTVRVEPTWVHLAESAALAATLALRMDCPPAALPTERLQRHLLANGIGLTFFNDVDLSTGDETARAAHFWGCRGFFESFDARLSDPLDDETRQRWSDRLRTACGMASPPPPSETLTRGAFLLAAFRALPPL